MTHDPSIPRPGALRNVEFKARCTDLAAARRAVEAAGARSAGTDRQVDTYFRARTGRLKLRVGSIERALIQYHRPDAATAKLSRVTLVPLGEAEAEALKTALSESLGVLVEVAKTRAIYFADNVKIHLDDVDGLGAFAEVEAIDPDGTTPLARLRAQCDAWQQILGVAEADMVETSYSDLLMRP